MKKILAILLATTLTLSFSACGASEETASSSPSDTQSVADENVPNEDADDDEKTDPEDAPTDEPNDEPTDDANNEQETGGPLELLTNVWNSYGDDEKFPAAGGDMSEENMAMDGPGKFSVADTAALDSTLGFPPSSADKINDAASLMHMMNANTFTCGAFRLASPDDADDVSAAIKDNIMQRQWLCGFPDKLVIVRLDDQIISFFGENEIVDIFKEKLFAAYPSAEAICDEPIA